MIEAVLFILALGLILIVLNKLRAVSRSIQHNVKGWTGEKKVALKIWASLDDRVYHRWHDLTTPSRNGTAQIDHLLVSKYGLFIVETKNKKGWIFGSQDQAKWTQSVFGKNYSFQNPIRQAYRQKKVLSEFLGVNEALIHTVIFFVGDCKFKTKMPSNVIQRGLGSHIKKYRETTLSREEVERILGLLRTTISENRISRNDHIKSLNKRHSSKSICPRCGSMLVVRVAKSGKNPGREFLGCSNFPRCRFTKNT